MSRCRLQCKSCQHKSIILKIQFAKQLTVIVTNAASNHSSFHELSHVFPPIAVIVALYCFAPCLYEQISRILTTNVVASLKILLQKYYR